MTPHRHDDCNAIPRRAVWTIVLLHAVLVYAVWRLFEPAVDGRVDVTVAGVTAMLGVMLRHGAELHALLARLLRQRRAPRRPVARDGLASSTWPRVPRPRLAAWSPDGAAWMRGAAAAAAMLAASALGTAERVDTPRPAVITTLRHEHLMSVAIASSRQHQAGLPHRDARAAIASMAIASAR